MTSTSTKNLHELKAEISRVYHMPYLDLIFKAQEIHRRHHNPETVQLSHLLSIKTGGCREDCAYCPQSAHYKTPVVADRIWDVDRIIESAILAKKAGATRFCMGAAWSSPPKKGAVYQSLLTAAREVKQLGLEVCMTLGMLNQQQASELQAAGVDYYNHNLDTSREYYQKIITTRSYDDRLKTLDHVRRSGMKVCCGGIIGMGESLDDRIGLLTELCLLDPPPESVPINQFVKVQGTPLLPSESFDSRDMIRMIATTRIMLPQSVIRLSAGRKDMTEDGQSLCFLAGANSLFIGEKLLTTSNPEPAKDLAMLQKLGLKPSTHQALEHDDKEDAGNNSFEQV
ncbi:MAG: biotin synthase BioB [Proteobacteria bacterium]|nr:biotin synthase BioB [Pseudomonadota bacterium]